MILTSTMSPTVGAQFLFLAIWLQCFSLRYFTFAVTHNEATLVYSMVSVEYDWPQASGHQQALENGKCIVENNLITGIKVFKGNVYVTVPRWRPGVPSTLNMLVEKGGRTVLQPYPSWEMNTIGDCRGLQYVQSMEIDPNTGLMWIIDTGRINTIVGMKQNLCQPKLVVYNIIQRRIEFTYRFPAEVVSPSTNFMNDIVLDYINGEVKFAYITDTSDAKIYVFDVERRESYFFQHRTMNSVPLEPVTQAGLISAAIDGIAISSDFKTVYYSTVTAHPLYAIPTAILRDKEANFSASVTTVGDKVGGSDGMGFGQRALFYGAFEEFAVYRAEFGPNLTSMSQSVVLRDNATLGWTDTLAFDGDALWLMANDLHRFSHGKMSFNGSKANMNIWRVKVGQTGYLDQAAQRTAQISAVGTIWGTGDVAILKSATLSLIMHILCSIFL